VTEEYTIKVGAVTDDTQAVLELWRNGFVDLHGAAAQAKLAHSYLDNPAGPGVFFFLKSAEAPGFVGVQSLVQRIFHHRDQAMMAGIMADYVVDSRHRSLGPALLLLQSSSACGRENFGFVYGMPNKKAQPVLKRAGLTPLGMMVRYSKPLRSRPFLATRIAPRWLSPVAWLVDAGMWALDVSRALGLRQACDWQAIDADDPSLDEVWRCSEKAALTLGERSRRILAWRYPQGEAGWQVFIARNKRTREPMGYVVCRERHDVVVINDFYCVRPLRQTGEILLGFSRLMRRRRVSSLSLEFFGAQAVICGLHRAGFAAREHNPIFSVQGSAALGGTEQWYFTGFDRDTD